MLLIISSKSDETVNYFLSRTALNRSSFYRINTEDLHIRSKVTVDYQNGTILHTFCDRVIEYDRVTAVWYRRPDPILLSPSIDSDPFESEFLKRENEKLWGGIFESLNTAKWVNHPQMNLRANYKPEQLFRAKRFGLDIPKTIITDSSQTASDFVRTCNEVVVIKPISFGYIQRETEKDDTLIYTNVLTAPSKELLQCIDHSPTFLQEFIEKIYDVRINYINCKLIAFAIHSQEIEENQVDFRRNNSAGLRYSPFTVPHEIENKLLSLINSYGLNFAAIDMVLDKEGRLIFLEINPNGQWAWLEEETGVALSQELYRSLQVC